MGKLFTFLREVWAELKKVTWPTWVEVVGSTVVVILTSMMFAVMIGIWDKLLSELVILLF
jgi:preprotein translocase subunit SecE